jgi:hypothetical protein
VPARGRHGDTSKTERPATARAEQIGNDQRRWGFLAPVQGHRSLGLDVAIAAFDKVNVASPILIS